LLPVNNSAQGCFVPLARDLRLGRDGKPWIEMVSTCFRGVSAEQDGGKHRQEDELCPQQKERIELMSGEKTQNVQDVFLNHIRKNKVPVTIFLINGVKLQGVVSSFDNFSLLLRRDGHVQLVYKHAVSTVMPSTVIRLYEPGAEAEEGAWSDA
jgi:host factor-I protein